MYYAMIYMHSKHTCLHTQTYLYIYTNVNTFLFIYQAWSTIPVYRDVNAMKVKKEKDISVLLPKPPYASNPHPNHTHLIRGAGAGEQGGGGKCPNFSSHVPPPPIISALTQHINTYNHYRYTPVLLSTPDCGVSVDMSYEASSKRNSYYQESHIINH